MPRSFLFQTIFFLTGAAGSPLPSSTDDDQSQPGRRSLTGDEPVQAWEIAALLLGFLFFIMVLGALGGVCEIAVAGRIKKSNDEADAMADANGSRGIEDRFSWAEASKIDLGDATTLAGSQPDPAQDAQDIDERGDWDGVSEAAQQTADGTDEQKMSPWMSGALPVPSPSRFVTDDLDSPGDGIAHDNGLSFEAYPSHLTPRPATPGEAGYQHDEAGDQSYSGEDDATLSEVVYQHQDVGDEYYTGEDDETLGGSDHQPGDEMMAPPQAYLGDGYSPAFMPESADYLPQYGQSLLQVQNEDGSYTAARVSYASARVVSYVSPARTPQ